jgi:hypothetical protein
MKFDANITHHGENASEICHQLVGDEDLIGCFRHYPYDSLRI